MSQVVLPDSVPRTTDTESQPPLVLHLIYRLAMGGLENGLVNMINHMPVSRYRHVIVCLTDFTDFRNRITRSDVDVVAIHKKSGVDWGSYRRIWKVIKQCNPMIFHTRNLPTMEYAIVATLAGVPYRVHGEHGRDIHDQYGASRKFQLFRKFLMFWIHQCMAVSQDLANWLHQVIGVKRNFIHQVYNGVDVQRFHARHGTRVSCLPKGFASDEMIVIGTVGRLQRVKDQATLVRAFCHLRQMAPDVTHCARLVLIGDGPIRGEIQQIIEDEGIQSLVWMAGERQDIPDLMRSLDLFVLPSEAEGISNTILEAMSSGLPIVATDVGGNSELVKDGNTGLLVPPKNPSAMADAMAKYLMDHELMLQHGAAGRTRAESHFSMDVMVDGYSAVYDALLNKGCASSHQVM